MIAEAEGLSLVQEKYLLGLLVWGLDQRIIVSKNDHLSCWLCAYSQR